MDAYVRVGVGTDAVRTVQRWLNSRFLTRADFFLVPCDGIYSRSVQQGLMFAIQYEIGMADGVATGNYGPATQQGIRDYGTAAKDGTRKMVSLFQAALIFNGYSSPFNGTIDAAASSVIRDFQSFAELPVTGAADYATWSSLLISTGDTTRAGIAADMAKAVLPATANRLYSAGYRIIGRYLNGSTADGSTKRLGPAEATDIWNSGLRWFPIYQEANDIAGAFSSTLGSVQGQRVAVRMRQLGIKSGSTVYLAVDFDATTDDIPTLIIPHFQAAAAAMAADLNSSYKFGVYGTRNVCSRLGALQITTSSFVSDMSTGYSGNLGFPLPANWAYDQILNIKANSTSGFAIEIDKDVASSRATSLSSSDVLRTPRTYSGGVPVGYDEAFYWPLTALMYRVDAAGSASLMDQYIRNDIDLNWLQQPDYWGTTNDSGPNFAWNVITPSIETRVAGPQEQAKKIQAVRGDFQAAVGGSIYPTPSLGPLGQVDHWAASTRGFMSWAMPASGSADLSNGDIASWALDLVQAWNQYEAARLRASGGVLDVSTWCSTNIGTAAESGFDIHDLKADMAAYLCAKRVESNHTRTLDDIVREMLVSIEDDSGWLARTFFSERFGSSRPAVIAAATNVFVSNWPAIWGGRIAFLKTRYPGALAGTLNPSATVRASELNGLANGFADALERAMLWT